MSFPFLYILSSLPSSLTVYILPSWPIYKYKYKYKYILINDNLPKETAEIETGTAEKPDVTRQNRRQNLGLVWRNRKKISQIIKDHFYLPFFLLIILCLKDIVQPKKRGV